MTLDRQVVAALATFFALWSFAGSASAAGSAPPPNIVMILADDTGWGDVSFNGRKEWSTPNLDRLGARGTIFRRFYTAAAVCGPSRAALLTGKYSIHNGACTNSSDLPGAEVTMAEALKTHGYSTAMFGKWHHGRPRAGEALAKFLEGEPARYVHPNDQGFDTFFGFTDAVHAWQKFPLVLWDGRKRTHVSGYADDLFAQHAIDFLRKHKQEGSGRPFFIYVAFTANHFNIQAPPEEVALHRGKFPEVDPAKPVRATYAAMATRLDKDAGRVLDALDELGFGDNTLVVFSSDQGATFEKGNQGASSFLDSNAPFRGQKRTVWEGGIRVPGIACWPGHIPAGVVSLDLVHTTDLMPTFLAAAGYEPEPAWKVDGQNMLPVWTGKAKATERTLFWEWRSEGSNQVAAMRGNFKLVITNDGQPELFDVEADPAERRNIFAEHVEAADELEHALRAWLASETH
jgi:arylsulfatase A-like enzyme